MPSDLPEGARVYWRRLVNILDALNLIHEADAIAIKDLAICLLRLQECEADLTRRGLLIKGDHGVMTKNPSATLARYYRQSIYRLLGEFGLSPVSRARIFGDVQADAHNDELERILSG